MKLNPGEAFYTEIEHAGFGIASPRRMFFPLRVFHGEFHLLSPSKSGERGSGRDTWLDG